MNYVTSLVEMSRSGLEEMKSAFKQVKVNIKLQAAVAEVRSTPPGVRKGTSSIFLPYNSPKSSWACLTSNYYPRCK